MVRLCSFILSMVVVSASVCLGVTAQTDFGELLQICWHTDQGRMGEEQTVVLQSEQDITAFQTQLKEKGWENEKLQDVLSGYATQEFLEQNLLVVMARFGLYSGDGGAAIITDVTAEGDTAVIYYTPREKPTGDDGIGSILGVSVQVIPLPRSIAESCTQFRLNLDMSYWQNAEPTGDVDGDGCADAVDALYVLQNAVGKRELNAWQQLDGDMDKNGILDASDALLILKKAVSKKYRMDTLQFFKIAGFLLKLGVDFKREMCYNNLMKMYSCNLFDVFIKGVTINEEIYICG